MASSPRVLGLDTAMSVCSVALCEGDRVLANRRVVMERGHAEALMPMVRDVLEAADCAFRDLDLIAVTNGPGTFTGIRIGLAAAKGMAMTASLPLVGVTTFEAIVHAVGEDERGDASLLVVLATKSTGYYAQAFSRERKPVNAPCVADRNQLAGLVCEGEVVVAGDGARDGLEALTAAGVGARLCERAFAADAIHVAQIAAMGTRSGEISRAPVPLYLRPPATTLAGPGRRP
ncbi:MAG: tRNA (adenosine(37)-N6)-threonylcarbamoyltransferase complex dimerization subunit type 1 TsaB [Rhodospirillales bacterium]|jgi:tRNA threonylcarbamoyladenosine biosynthesis protein TsaB|nr:tRNA (adenosine(37)-N6)-threonylcarbamoyltransferase complex dimerization subunit type 1 TsaB [Rhodospirillales bacterium]